MCIQQKLNINGAFKLNAKIDFKNKINCDLISHRTWENWEKPVFFWIFLRSYHFGHLTVDYLSWSLRLLHENKVCGHNNCLFLFISMTRTDILIGVCFIIDGYLNSCHLIWAKIQPGIVISVNSSSPKKSLSFGHNIYKNANWTIIHSIFRPSYSNCMTVLETQLVDNTAFWISWPIKACQYLPDIFHRAIWTI